MATLQEALEAYKSNHKRIASPTHAVVPEDLMKDYLVKKEGYSDEQAQDFINRIGEKQDEG